MRSDASAAAGERLGARTARGEITDRAVLSAAAAEADGVIHLAFRHDLMATGQMEQAAAEDLAAIESIADALDGSGKAFVGISGTAGLAGLGRPATEDDVVRGTPRSVTEQRSSTLPHEASGARSPVTHSAERDRHGFVRVLIAAAQRTGAAAYVGDGATRWALDTARLLGWEPREVDLLTDLADDRYYA